MASLTTVAERPTLSYRVVAGVDPTDPRNPNKRILRPLIVDKERYDTPRALRFSMENGYIQGGQFFSNYGVVNGFLEGVQRLGKDGRDILLNGWLRIHPEMRGTVDPETRLIGPENEIHVCAQVQANLRRKASEFTWTCVDDNGSRAHIQHLQSVGGARDKEIFAGAKISVGGTRLAYNAATDRITASWQTTDAETQTVTEHSVELVPESSGYSAMVLPFPEGLADAPVGTEVTFSFFSDREQLKARPSRPSSA